MSVSRAVSLSILLCGSTAFAQSAPPPRDVTLSAPDGTQLRATYYAAAQPGPAVLLLHMCNTTRRSWDPLAPRLAAAGIHAVSFDYRGFGESGGDRLDGMPPQEAQRVINDKWPGDMDAAYQFLVSQSGIDRARIGAAGGSCGVNQAVRLARRHPQVRSLALLAGPLDPDGIAFITSTPWLPIFAAAADDDQYDAGAPELMRWILSLSGNPRNKFSGFRDGKHGTEIFGPHPELVTQMVAWYTDTLVKRPADSKMAVDVRNTPAREFWRKATTPAGVDEAVQMFYDLAQTGRRAALFPEGALNQLGYNHLQAGRTEEAIRLFRLNTMAYPASANTYDSLADAYLANGQNELALRMSQKALELLPKDRSSEERKKAIRESAEQKIGKLQGGQGKAAAPRQDEYRQDAESIKRGQDLFDRNCAACHNFANAEIGPNLAGATVRREKPWLVAFIRNAPEMFASGDRTAVELRKQSKAAMPPFPTLQPEEVEQILAYLDRFAEAPAKPAPTRPGALTDPIPGKIASSGLTIVLQKVLTFPVTADEAPMTRINKLLPLPDGSNERLFVHDLRGKLYEVKNGQPRVYLDITTRIPNFIHVPGLGTGLGSFSFHPEFASNGLLYATHTEPAKAAPADFPIPDPVPVRLQWVLSEWKADDPRADSFAGSRRELLRADMYSQIHGFQELTFNPLAKRGDPDYGLLYLGVGDGGAGVTKFWAECCANRVWGAVWRIDPAGRNSGNGKYGIPADNPFVKTPGAPAEVWARGFRNPHRISWDLTGSRKMVISEIGQSSIEELNLGVRGAHYGWPQREGTFATDLPSTPGVVYPRPEQDATVYTYPAAQFDHDEGNAVSGGFVYAGTRVPLLRGKYVFGDIMRGRVFLTDVSGLEPGAQAPIHELAIEVDGNRTDLATVTRSKRVDLRFGQDGTGELYVFTKADGVLWKVVDCRKSSP